MPTLLSIITGLLAGGLHVFSGPDHLAALAPLALHERRGAWRAGMRWGLGHASGVLVVGLLALMVRGWMTLPAISAGAERLVGVVLIGVGIWGIRRALSARVHIHEHQHGGHARAHVHVHVHVHAHAGGAPHVHTQEVGRLAHTHPHAAFFVGTLHGAAGTSHFLGVLPALAFPTWTQTLSYLAAYGGGTMLAMMTFSSLLGWLGRLWGGRQLVGYQIMMLGCSGVAVVVGGFWLFL